MPGSFIDTRALAKHYHVEPGSTEVDRLWTDVGRTLFISRVGVVETISVFAGKVRSVFQEHAQAIGIGRAIGRAGLPARRPRGDAMRHRDIVMFWSRTGEFAQW